MATNFDNPTLIRYAGVPKRISGSQFQFQKIKLQ